MIVYDLACTTHGHRFEGWFAGSADYVRQQEQGMLSCPQCGCVEIGKAPMAPSVSAKSNSGVRRLPVACGPDAKQNAALKALAKLQTKALEGSEWVGREFAERARQMHYGERDRATIHGEATLGEAKDMLDEGIGVAPLPLPVTPPDKLN